MKSRPILFRGELVNAILQGHKTQTRRIAKSAVCDYGEVGDSLWVRETFAPANNGGVESILYRANGERIDLPKDENWNLLPPVPESWDFGIWAGDLESGAEKGWKPSIFLPRWASRISLSIKAIRREPLQDITAEDALAEGITMPPHETDPRVVFRMLWDEINCAKAPWYKNPDVWVIEFAIENVTSSCCYISNSHIGHYDRCETCGLYHAWGSRFCMAEMK